MSNVPLIDSSDDPQAAALIERLRKGRRGTLLGIYKALLHNVALAQSWFGHLNAVRWETTLSGRLREIVIIRVGWRLGSAYILKQHIPKLAEPEGLDLASCNALLQEDPGDGFSPAERAAIALADEITLHARPRPQTVEAVKAHYDDRQFVEMNVLIGTYNMHARFVAGVGLEPEKD